MTPKAALAAAALSSLAVSVSAAVAVFVAVADVVAAVSVAAVVVCWAAAPVTVACACCCCCAATAAPVGSAAGWCGCVCCGWSCCSRWCCCPVGAVAVAAAAGCPGTGLGPWGGLPGRDPLPVPPAGSLDRGMVSVAQGRAPGKDGSPGKDRVCVLQAGAFEEGLAAVPQVGGLQVHTMEAFLPPGALAGMIPVIEILVIMLTIMVGAPIGVSLRKSLHILRMLLIPVIPPRLIPVSRSHNISGRISIIRRPSIAIAVIIIQQAV